MRGSKGPRFCLFWFENHGVRTAGSPAPPDVRTKCESRKNYDEAGRRKAVRQDPDSHSGLIGAASDRCAEQSAKIELSKAP